MNWAKLCRCARLMNRMTWFHVVSGPPFRKFICRHGAWRATWSCCRGNGSCLWCVVVKERRNVVLGGSWCVHRHELDWAWEWVGRREVNRGHWGEGRIIGSVAWSRSFYFNSGNEILFSITRVEDIFMCMPLVTLIISSLWKCMLMLLNSCLITKGCL